MSEATKLKNLAAYLDLANHHPSATPQEIKTLCQTVLKYKFNSAFVNPYYVKLAKEVIGQGSKVGTVVSFPLGQDTLVSKIKLALESAGNGADELDICANVGLLKGGLEDDYSQEMKEIVKRVKDDNAEVIVKFIIETGYLTDQEIKKASLLVLDSGADFVKTCSGMGPRGASVKDIQLIREAVGQKIKVKAAGGIETRAQAIQLIEAGADRLGTSHAVEIVEGRNPAPEHSSGLRIKE